MPTMSDDDDILDIACVNCMWCTKDGYLLSCVNPDTQSWDPVTGWDLWASPSILRMADGKCGPEGRHYEPKLMKPKKGKSRWSSWWTRFWESPADTMGEL